MMKNNFYVALCAIGTGLVAASCHEHNTEQAANLFAVKGDTITIPPHSHLKDRLKTITLKDEPYRLQIITTGVIKAIPTQYAEIAPPFQGRVTKTYLHLGMKTTPSTPLFEISSPDFITAQKIFFQEKSQMLQTQKTLKRQQDLMANGVGAQKDMEEAQTAYEVEKKEYENAVIGIKIFKADPEKLSLGQPLIVHAPITGEVVDNKVVLGQFIKDDAASVATVADLSKVWIAGQVKEKDIRYVHQQDECDIQVSALPGKHLKGKVYHVNDMVDDDTRSVQVLMECNNNDHALKPGMYATVDFIDAPTSAILIPQTALLQMSGTNFVFVITPDGKYIKRKVVTGGNDNDRVVITSGLKSGEEILSEGGFYLLEAR
ncbi:membrane fusion protein, cobalt-zinc-cadmium efflux system [Mucilaginibacter lappiensis]|uniref:Cobalt-zinc-cadmium efflux system membrane fusion protein n=1 Tax=Mucilaginibacter lappiensis TaxID=354630 RepID=A0ABR6PKG8_9SPHI|nr:efflux RND transporter periplasmic adaptor subunit [Mucilaginibacter lappiensis]MBB6110258.1 cobalt-zinc-cadmium efflux system membrane fusion protein [Mucilaginibacter lappiensis]SIR28166.1 membrane fusion protein, cobalt-zinc-cadmium efflux system [Mucilaginibacter lappiensis]